MKLRSSVQPSNDISNHLQARSGSLAPVATLVSGAVLGLVGGVGIDVDGILGAAAVAAVHIATAFPLGLASMLSPYCKWQASMVSTGLA